MIETRGHHGTFVAASEHARAQAARAEADAYARRLPDLGVPAAEGLRLAARALGLPSG